MKLRTIFATLAVAIMLCPCVAPAQVIISEIMYNPDGADVDTTAGVAKEWVELYNAGASTVSLAGWRIDDLQDGTPSDPLPAGASIAPGQALVVTGDAASFDAQWSPGGGVSRYEVGSMPSLANSPSATNETVALRNAFGLVVDTVNYDDSGAWPSDSPDGASIMLTPPGLSVTGNDAGAHWKPSMMGVYGGRFAYGPDGSQDRASPGVVETIAQSPFEPSPDAAWSMVVIPDTQSYVRSSANRAILTQMTQWVVDNRDAFNVQFVLQEGDIVNQNSRVEPTSGDQSGDQQWANAKASFSLLDGVVPYAFAPGNHDYGTTNAQDRSTQFNDYFKATDNPLVDPAQGGTLREVMTPGELDNALHEFTAPDGREMLVLTTEWGPRQVAVDWANAAIGQPGLEGRTAALVTHAYLDSQDNRHDHTVNPGAGPYGYPTADDTHDGEELWQELVSPNGPFEMVFSGHVGGDGVSYLRSTGAEGQSVHQMMFNTQFEVYGGNGYFRVLEFLEDGRTVRVRTYSPFHDLQRTDEANNFEFHISPLLKGDYNGDGVVDSADFTVWRDNLGRGGAPWITGDGDGDGVVGMIDYHIWVDAFGSSLADSQALSHGAAPEPASLWLVAMGLLVLATPGRYRAA
ncbi:hypothetical protein Mal64_39350 [Pseudobythopirellula maris]|uniref:LTD domain-containing protein n=1 Tax=Pseudobythopirellula maris TaxID=2527991 RepID=A0A5C5ZFU2_9BACT|nr:lamin tail domain-containing protein [Pseudobythopirellula maris]TWT86192.1 hypothetical protein Mal64_39350 [Pseudobythopirellula maris]